jgi:hypothetical protein
MSSGLPLKADLAQCSRRVAFVPTSDSDKITSGAEPQRFVRQNVSPVPIRNSFGGGRSIGRLRLQNAVLDFLLFSGSEGVENLEADGPSLTSPVGDNVRRQNSRQSLDAAQPPRPKNQCSNIKP